MLIKKVLNKLNLEANLIMSTPGDRRFTADDYYQIIQGNGDFIKLMANSTYKINGL